MSHNIQGENVKLWRTDYEGQNGTYSRYSLGVSRKNQDGTYTSSYMPVRFAKSTGVDANPIHNGTLITYTGFLTVDSYKDKEGKEVKNTIVMITNVSYDREDTPEFKSGEPTDSFAEVIEDIPF